MNNASLLKKVAKVALNAAESCRCCGREDSRDELPVPPNSAMRRPPPDRSWLLLAQV